MASLKQIRYFLSVADLGSLTQAAARLCIAQPALSRQIALLEGELGFPLFVREARGVSLTPAGQIYRQRVGSLEQMLAAAAEEGGQLARGEAGVLRLLHSSSIPASSLLPAIRQFLEECPGARIELDRIASETQIGELAGGNQVEHRGLARDDAGGFRDDAAAQAEVGDQPGQAAAFAVHGGNEAFVAQFFEQQAVAPGQRVIGGQGDRQALARQIDETDARIAAQQG